jgi:hypothetical protein
MQVSVKVEPGLGEEEEEAPGQQLVSCSTGGSSPHIKLEAEGGGGMGVGSSRLVSELERKLSAALVALEQQPYDAMDLRRLRVKYMEAGSKQAEVRTHVCICNNVCTHMHSR